MPVKSLVELATAVIYKNIKELDSVGDYLPYENVRHILLKVDQAAQLRQIELNSPQVEGETGEIWLRLIERDFPLELKAKSYKPQNPKKWYRVWEKYKKDHDDALAESENKLRNAMAGLQQNKEKNLSRVVSRKNLPGAGRLAATVKRGPGRDNRPSVFDFHGGKRMKLGRGLDVMRKVRREAKEIAMIHKGLSRPALGMAQNRSRLTQAPAAMLNDRRRAAQPAFRAQPARWEDDQAEEDEEEEVPDRARSSAVVAHEENAEFISDSEDDDGDGGHGEVFNDYPPPAKKTKMAPKAPAPSTARAADPVVAGPSGSAPRPGPKLTSASTARPSHKGVATSAATSLLKKRPAASQVLRQSAPSRPAVPKPRPSLPASSASPRPPPRDSPSKLVQRLPRSQTSPPPPIAARATTSSHDASSSTQAAPADARGPPLKRKATDIFMRPRKRPL